MKHRYTVGYIAVALLTWYGVTYIAKHAPSTGQTKTVRCVRVVT